MNQSLFNFLIHYLNEAAVVIVLSPHILKTKTNTAKFIVENKNILNTILILLPPV